MTQPPATCERRVLVLAAHGAGDGSATNRAVLETAGRFRATQAWADVLVAFHKGAPGFAETAAHLHDRNAIVVPLLTSRGYYFDKIAAAFTGETAGVGRTITAPLGEHPALAERIQSAFQELAAAQRIDRAATTLLVVGHGTKRHSLSRKTTEGIVERLAASGCCPDIRAAFLDEHPTIHEAVAASAGRHLVAVPFLMGGGSHADKDVPAALGLPPARSPDETQLRREDGRFFACIRVLALGPDTDALILELALATSLIPTETERPALP